MRENWQILFTSKYFGDQGLKNYRAGWNMTTDQFVIKHFSKNFHLVYFNPRMEVFPLDLKIERDWFDMGHGKGAKVRLIRARLYRWGDLATLPPTCGSFHCVTSLWGGGLPGLQKRKDHKMLDLILILQNWQTSLFWVWKFKIQQQTSFFWNWIQFQIFNISIALSSLIFPSQ